jgi:excisionase family DNA binding protein
MTTDQKSHHYDRLMTREEVAEYLGVSEMTIHRLERRGSLPRVEISKRVIRYRASDLDDLIKKRLVMRVYE